ncbi:unnamed protein product [Urochloa humidicola]
MWNVLGQVATVAQLVGADVGGLITMIIQAAITAQQNKKECEQLARRVFTVGELLQHLDPEVLRRPELHRPLAGMSDTLREAHELVMACQDKSTVYRTTGWCWPGDKLRSLEMFRAGSTHTCSSSLSLATSTSLAVSTEYTTFYFQTTR